MDPGLLQDIASNPLADSSGDGVELMVGVGVWIAAMLAAPLLVIVLAVLLLSVEIPVAIALGLLVAAVRFAGIVPWRVTITDGLDGSESHESYRNLIRALRRVSAINPDQKVLVRWSWM